MVIETSRLIVRPVLKGDAEDIFEYAKNPVLSADSGWEPHKDLKETRRIINRIITEQYNFFVLELKYNGKVIGNAGLIQDPKRTYNRVMTLEFALNEDYRGKGYMSEACSAVIEYGFYALDLEMITFYCYPYNINALNVIKRLGFTFEGRLSRCEQRFDGKILDHDCYCLTHGKHHTGTILKYKKRTAESYP